MFPAVVGQEELECQLEIEAAELPQFKSWRVVTSMNRAGAEPYGFGGYVAADYAELIDHPVEIGDLSIGDGVATTNVGIPYNVSDTEVQIARRIRDAINSPATRAVLAITAATPLLSSFLSHQANSLRI